MLSLKKYLISLQLWQLKTLFVDGLMSSKNFFLKTPRLATLQKLESNFFHSITVDRKYNF